MILNVTCGNLPALYRVATFAVGPELASMDICVAIRTMCADVGEHHRGVALGATDIAMHAAQWIAGLIVIEFGHRADRLPARIRVTVLA